MKEQIAGTKAIAQRVVNAYANFVSICEDRGFNADQAAVILEAYKKAKVVKLNVAQGRYDFKHGVFAEADVMRNALEV